MIPILIKVHFDDSEHNNMHIVNSLYHFYMKLSSLDNSLQPFSHRDGNTFYTVIPFNSVDNTDNMYNLSNIKDMSSSEICANIRRLYINEGLSVPDVEYTILLCKCIEEFIKESGVSWNNVVILSQDEDGRMCSYRRADKGVVQVTEDENNLDLWFRIVGRALECCAENTLEVCMSLLEAIIKDGVSCKDIF